MVDLMIGVAFVAMILIPAVLGSFQRSKSQDGDA